jgi:hypothetical protein
MPELVGYPNVGRFGLTHSLLAWARCHLWCADNQLEMLAPSWLYLKVGPYLRRERDKRAYHRLFHFPDYTTGLRRLALLTVLPRVTAEDVDLAAELARPGRRLVVFNNRWSENEDYHFHHIVGRSSEVRGALERMTKAKFMPSGASSPHIAVHIRMGDFRAQAMDDVRAGTTCARLPMAWYVDMVQALRARLGRELPVRLYSDGQDSDLAPVLSLSGVTRVEPRAAITDLLAIARASVFVSSGSGFSFWGSYLGDVPRVCFPGQRHYRVLGGPAPVDREPECEHGSEIPASFIEHVAQRLGPKP